MREVAGLPEVLRWTGSSLVVLDQRALPHQENYLELTTPEEVAQAIQSMAVRGAPLIGIAAGYGLALAHLRGDDTDAAAGKILSARPTAVNLALAVERVRASEDPVREAVSFHRQERERCLSIAEHGAGLVKPGSRLMTYCNTGALATGGIGTALGIIYRAWFQGKIDMVWVPETRPFFQGARLTSWELASVGVPQTLIADNAVFYLMSRGLVDAVFVGADRIARNMDTANKVGTLGLALAAKHFSVPFYVAAPTTSFDPEIATGEDIEIEERDASELLWVAGRALAPPGVQALYPGFDITPRDLITGFITEEGFREA